MKIIALKVRKVNIHIMEEDPATKEKARTQAMIVSVSHLVLNLIVYLGKTHLKVNFMTVDMAIPNVLKSGHQGEAPTKVFVDLEISTMLWQRKVDQVIICATQVEEVVGITKEDHIHSKEKTQLKSFIEETSHQLKISTIQQRNYLKVNSILFLGQVSAFLLGKTQIPPQRCK